MTIKRLLFVAIVTLAVFVTAQTPEERLTQQEDLLNNLQNQVMMLTEKIEYLSQIEKLKIANSIADIANSDQELGDKKVLDQDHTSESPTTSYSSESNAEIEGSAQSLINEAA